MEEKKTHIYFASDLHLGVPNREASLKRERRFIRWLNSIREDATALYLMGDLFDYWHEYKHVVPKGYVRLLGKLAELRDEGLPIFIFTGNHDLWMFDYFEKELDIPVFHEPIVRTFNGKKFFLGHGDGLGPGDYGYKMMKKVFTNRFCQWAYRQIHPNWATAMAQFWSQRSKEAQQGSEEEVFKGKEREWLYLFAKNKLKEEHFDYFVFGHRHLPLNIDIDGQSKYINLGDWINYYSYAKFDGQEIHLCYFERD